MWAVESNVGGFIDPVKGLTELSHCIKLLCKDLWKLTQIIFVQASLKDVSVVA